ncbi:ABC transporter substrate-binding protein [Mesorhizobium sp. C416B]|uniref:ABC transporter substrate-binding protein n=1 Tax=unclassified Mesorhizobium TaxID=325217 RepID=UPI0003CE650B|nr:MULTISPECIES: ABC transporter substrate-binding protein [unclassified Mesorhizobium]ESX56931.1 peptide ABC transporter substrate-binding protein [Mesorhizobium sp. LSHC422A00]WJI65528.1 ABC transporter substrate-binding protein [Mesorhizobium sp. C416B]
MTSKFPNEIVHGSTRRQFLKTSAALGASAMICAALPSIASAGPVRGGTLKAGMVGGATTDSLDPAVWTSNVPTFLGRHWAEQLVEVSPSGKVEPALAEAFSSSPDAMVWTFKIRKGVQFHDGKEMTPADVVATLERHSDAKSKSGALGLLGAIDKISAVNQDVVISLKAPNADFPYLMADYHLMIQPNGGKDNPTAGIGTGPYHFTVNEPGVRHVGERFANYWRTDRGFADRIEIIIINDSSARMAALQGGIVDIVNRVEPKVVDLIKRAPGVTIRDVAGRGHYLFAAHCNTAPFDNKDLRLALKYAIDRQEMVDKILMGYGSVGNDTPINKSYPFFTDAEQRSFDPDKAKFHFKKSGYDGAITLRTSDVAFPGAVDAAQLYQQSAAKAGITLDIRREPGDGYWAEVWNKQPFCASYWAGRPTQDQMFSTLYYSKADWNETRFFRDDFDKMLLAARGELDQEKRKKLYADMNEILRDDGGAIIPMFNDFIDATGPRVGGWVDDGNQEMMGAYALSKCWVQA